MEAYETRAFKDCFLCTISSDHPLLWSLAHLSWGQTSPVKGLLVVAVLTELDPLALTHSHAPPCRDNELRVQNVFPPWCVSVLFSPFLPTLSPPSSAFLFLLPFHPSPPFPLSLQSSPFHPFSLSLPSLPPPPSPLLPPPFLSSPSLFCTYLSTEKTRAIFPTALILFLITSFRCRMLEAASDVWVCMHDMYVSA